VGKNHNKMAITEKGGNPLAGIRGEPRPAEKRLDSSYYLSGDVFGKKNLKLCQKQSSSNKTSFENAASLRSCALGGTPKPPKRQSRRGLCSKEGANARAGSDLRYSLDSEGGDARRS